MVYTQERLRDALQVFHASEPYRKRRNLPGSNLGNFLESRSKQYETRRGKASIAIRTSVTGIWADKDESGEYVPHQKKKVAARLSKAMKPASKTKRSHVDECGDQGIVKRAKSKVTYYQGRRLGLSMNVTLRFHSSAAKEKIAELFPAIEDVPEGSNHEHLDYDLDKKGSHFESFTLSRGNLPASSSSPFLLDPGHSYQPFALCDPHHGMTGFTSTATLSPPYASMDFPPTSRSSPILIDDSDDSGTDHGSSLDGSQAPDEIQETKFIRTNFSHPIEYRCKPEACSFCLNYRYPIFGCGAVDVEVVQLMPGVYEEVDGGNRDKGFPVTKICLNCSVERMTIAQCPIHEILPIDGLSEGDFDYRSFYSHLTPSGSAEHNPVHLICSVCIQPAFYACATQQTMDAFGLPIKGEDESSCGLLLCGDCSAAVVSFGLDLERVERSAEGSRVFRADREFLAPGNDLLQEWMNRRIK
jgi:hypothetical protein